MSEDKEKTGASGVAKKPLLVGDINALVDEEIDSLPFGAIKVDESARVVFYSRTESELSGRPVASVLGRNFFAEIAPCTNTPEFAGAFFDGVEAGHLDHVFEYIFDFDMAPVQVRIHMRDAAEKDRYWILVELLKRLPEGTSRLAKTSLSAKLASSGSHQATSFDYSVCNKEPFEALGQVQSFGALIIVSRDTETVVGASETLDALFGVSAAASLGKPIGDVFSLYAAAVVLSATARMTAERVKAMEFRLVRPATAPIDALCRVYDWNDSWIIELEPWDGRETGLAASRALELQVKLRGCEAIEESAAAAVDAVRSITGHSRVTVYRIDPEGNGKVLAESRDGQMPPLIGLHFPASDLPRRARELYVHVPVRYVPSRDHAELSILSLSEEAPDVAPTQVRALSRIHREYHRALKVNGSLSLSLLVDGRLWGMIICHHPIPHAVSAARRTGCSLIAESLSLRIAQHEATEEKRATATAEASLVKLLAGMRGGEIWERWISRNVAPLCEAFEADHLLLVERFRVTQATMNVAETDSSALALFVATLSVGNVWATDCLSGHLELATHWQDWSAGACCICVTEGTALVLLRKATPHSVEWSHAPTAMLADEQSEQVPRPLYNFEAWLERRSQWSSPWTRHQLSLAKELLEHLRNLTRIHQRSPPHPALVEENASPPYPFTASDESIGVYEQDPLTGLATRGVFNRQLNLLCASPQVNPQFALLLIDVDNLKVTNDTLGHDAGDELLVHVARVLRYYCGKTDLVARIGGDEFALIIKTPSLLSDVAAYSRKLMAEVGGAAARSRLAFRPSVSVGVTIPDKPAAPGVLFKQVDLALYEAKSRGKNGFVVFDQHLADVLLKKSQMERRILGASFESCIVVHIQRQIALGPGQNVERFELLARWNDHRDGHLLPSEFLPTIERSGRLRELTQAILASALQLISSIPDDYSICQLSVNVTASDLHDPGFFDAVRAAADAGAFVRHRLEIEVTERALLHLTPDVLTRIGQLKQLGIGLALDDFGTGFSSIEHLRKLPVDTVKIDRSFVEGMSTSEGLALLTGMLALFREIGKVIVAEGVETEEQVRVLSELGCDFAQGYYFHRPESASPYFFTPQNR